MSTYENGSDRWKYIEGYDRRYSIDWYGNVNRCPDYSIPREKRAKLKPLKPTQHKDGTLYVTLFKDNKPKRFYIHTLVAQYFKANPHNFENIRHLDGNKSNNHVSNLEYANRSILQRKLDPKELPPVLCKSFGRILKNIHADEIRAMFADGKTVAEIARKFAAKREQVETCLYGTKMQQNYILELEKWNKPIPAELQIFFKKVVNDWAWKRHDRRMEASWEEQHGENWLEIVTTRTEAQKEVDKEFWAGMQLVN